MVNGAEGKRGLLKNVKLFVADEADKLLRNHTIEFNRIVARLPRDCQRTFWSATIDDRTERDLRNMTRIPESTLVQRVDPSELLTKNCANYVVRVPTDDAEAKYAVMELIEQFATFQQMLVFANQPTDADFIAGRLRAKGWSVDSMHGTDDGRERDTLLRRFRNKEVTVLISMDILSRGLDCADLDCIVNWGMPRRAARRGSFRHCARRHRVPFPFPRAQAARWSMAPLGMAPLTTLVSLGPIVTAAAHGLHQHIPPPLLPPP